MSGPRRAETELWPVRYRPREDELLSSWLVRLAHGMGLKVQTLCNLEFGSGRQIWNRDIDRLAPAWLLATLCRRTGVPMEVAQQTTLRVYEGALYRRYRASSTLPWVLTLKMYHRQWTGLGLQFCPACLAECDVCHYRKSWRLALCTVCPRHRCLLLDRCPACGAGVMFVRTELGRPELAELPELYRCHACSFDLRQSEVQQPQCLDRAAATWLTDLWLDLQARGNGPACLERAETLHVLCSLMTRLRHALRLKAYLVDRLGATLSSEDLQRQPIEMRSTAERHQLLQMAAWMMVDLPGRLKLAVEEHALRYNHLLRDFRHLPSSYLQTVSTMRRRSTDA